MLDIILTVCLVVLVPAYLLWRSLAARAKPATIGPEAYRRTLLLAAALLILLLATWILNHRSLAALGLAWPPGVPGMVGLTLSVCAVGALAAGVAIQIGRAPAGAKVLATMAAVPPIERRDAPLFLVFCLVVGMGWELLFRGYLLWSLTPALGLYGAVLVAAAAYGLAHGYRGLRPFAASLIAALVLTVAYALTRSLWWLMLFHTALPMIGALGKHLAQRRTRVAPLATAA